MPLRHGDMLFDHDLEAKALPYEGSAAVPLHHPASATCGFGRPSHRRCARVELRDLLPTLCDLAGIPIPPGIDGQSLMPFVRGESSPWRGWLHGEHEWGRFSNHWLSDGRTKYAWYSQTGHEQLFDLDTDQPKVTIWRPSGRTSWPPGEGGWWRSWRIEKKGMSKMDG